MGTPLEVNLQLGELRFTSQGDAKTILKDFMSQAVTQGGGIIFEKIDKIVSDKLNNDLKPKIEQAIDDAFQSLGYQRI